jgi:hypothetical protein
VPAQDALHKTRSAIGEGIGGIRRSTKPWRNAIKTEFARWDARPKGRELGKRAYRELHSWSQRSPRTRLPSLPDVFSDLEELADALEEGRGSAQNDLIKARRDQIASLAAHASPPGGSVACLSFASPPASAAAPDGVLIPRPHRPIDGD